MHAGNGALVGDGTYSHTWHILPRLLEPARATHCGGLLVSLPLSRTVVSLPAYPHAPSDMAPHASCVHAIQPSKPPKALQAATRSRAGAPRLPTRLRRCPRRGNQACGFCSDRCKCSAAGTQQLLLRRGRGVVAPRRFYPFHYAPMASDLVGLSQHTVSLQLGRPFRPFEQLLAVLPAASGALLPAPLRRLMTDPRSPILDFFPQIFRVDLEGKRNDWEGVVLVRQGPAPPAAARRPLRCAASLSVHGLRSSLVQR